MFHSHPLILLLSPHKETVQAFFPNQCNSAAVEKVRVTVIYASEQRLHFYRGDCGGFMLRLFSTLDDPNISIVSVCASPNHTSPHHTSVTVFSLRPGSICVSNESVHYRPLASGENPWSLGVRSQNGLFFSFLLRTLSVLITSVSRVNSSYKRWHRIYPSQ